MTFHPGAYPELDKPTSADAVLAHAYAEFVKLTPFGIKDQEAVHLVIQRMLQLLVFRFPQECKDKVLVLNIGNNEGIPLFVLPNKSDLHENIKNQRKAIAQAIGQETVDPDATLSSRDFFENEAYQVIHLIRVSTQSRFHQKKNFELVHVSDVDLSQLNAY